MAKRTSAKAKTAKRKAAKRELINTGTESCTVPSEGCLSAAPCYLTR
jgi:hypothetical protein